MASKFSESQGGMNMSRRLLWVMLVFAVTLSLMTLSAYASVYEKSVEGKVNGDKVFLRGGPGTEYERITTIGVNKSVQILAEETNGMEYPWYKVKVDGMEGWMYGQYVELESAKSASTPIPAEIIAEKAFVRENHDNKAKRIATLEEGDGLDLQGEWQGSEPYPWYKVKTDDGEGWIYGQLVRRLDGQSTQSAASQAVTSNTPPTGKNAPISETGIVSSEGDFVTVVARGQGTDRQKALNAAWIDAVRLAVGTILSSKSELNNDEFAESTIAHSRGVIESFDVVDEQNDGKRTTVTIQAKVHKEILKDATKTYAETQTVKADTKETVKTQMDISAKDATTEDKQQSGAALLREVLEAYGKPELFYSAALDPKIYFDKDTKKSYVKISEKFDEDMFWKEFLPKLRKALDGVAVKKVKNYYTDDCRKMIQNFTKNRRSENTKNYSGIPGNDAGPYLGWKNLEVEPNYIVAVPENNSTLTLYYLPFKHSSGGEVISSGSVRHYNEENMKRKIEDNENPELLAKLYIPLLDFTRAMASSAVFAISFLDKDGEEIYSQIADRLPLLSSVYPSLRWSNVGVYFRGNVTAFAPGFLRQDQTKEGSIFQNLFLDTKGHEIRIDLELDTDDLQKVDSMKFDVSFEKW
jgi:uncharacterized protein YraI